MGGEPKTLVDANGTVVVGKHVQDHRGELLFQQRSYQGCGNGGRASLPTSVGRGQNVSQDSNPIGRAQRVVPPAAMM